MNSLTTVNGTTYVTQETFDGLSEYSCSIPTGTTHGKRWKRDNHAYPNDGVRRDPKWFMGEYYELPRDDPDLRDRAGNKQIGIHWTALVVGEAPKESEGPVEVIATMPVHRVWDASSSRWVTQEERKRLLESRAYATASTALGSMTPASTKS